MAKLSDEVKKRLYLSMQSDLFLPVARNDVLALVSERCADHFGDLEDFGFAVTREQAQACLGE